MKYCFDKKKVLVVIVYGLYAPTIWDNYNNQYTQQHLLRINSTPGAS